MRAVGSVTGHPPLQGERERGREGGREGGREKEREGERVSDNGMWLHGSLD